LKLTWDIYMAEHLLHEFQNACFFMDLPKTHGNV